MNYYKFFIYFLCILAIVNLIDTFYTVLAINRWYQLGYDGINQELNPISKYIMQNFGLIIWIFLKSLISSGFIVRSFSQAMKQHNLPALLSPL